MRSFHSCWGIELLSSREFKNGILPFRVWIRSLVVTAGVEKAKSSANQLILVCVSCCTPMGECRFSESEVWSFSQCVSYGQVSSTHLWVRRVLPIGRSASSMKRRSLIRFCASDAWPYSEKASKARCHLDIGLLSFPPQCLPDHGSVAEKRPPSVGARRWVENPQMWISAPLTPTCAPGGTKAWPVRPAVHDPVVQWQRLLVYTQKTMVRVHPGSLELPICDFGFANESHRHAPISIANRQSEVANHSAR